MGKAGTGVRAASKTSIEISFIYEGERCRERIPIEPTPANIAKAKAHKQEIDLAIKHGVFNYAVTFPNSKHADRYTHPSDQPYKRYLNNWMRQYEHRYASSTRKGYWNAINNVIIPVFGDIDLKSLGLKQVRDWCSKQTTSNKRIANVLSIIRTSLADAVMDGIIDTNELKEFTYKNREKVKPRDYIQPFTAQEQNAILSVLEGQAQNLIKFAFWTGLRTSELIALQWQDIDEQKAVMHIRRAKTQVSKTAETTKTMAGQRTVKLLKPAFEALMDQAKYTKHLGDTVFHNPKTGTDWTGDQQIRRTLWIPALKKAQVAYRNPYQTRHTYASMMLSTDEEPMWVARQMGHSDWGMLRQVYGKWLDRKDDNAGKKAVDVYAAISTEKSTSYTKLEN